MKEKLKKINPVSAILLALGSLLLILALYIHFGFDNITVEQLIFSATVKTEATSFDAIKGGLTIIIIGIPAILLIYGLIEYLISKFIRGRVTFEIRFFKKRFEHDLFTMTKKRRLIVSIVIFFIMAFMGAHIIKLDKYIIGKLSTTEIFEKYYLDTNKAEITFEGKKHNLIYIYVESLESTLASKLNGGIFDESVIPNLESYAENNTNFSYNSGVGGFYSVIGTQWTVAAMIAQTSSTPLRLNIDGNSYSGYSSMMPGVKSLGEYLNDNGYKNYLMMGSDASYGGRRDYFTQHGNYEIYDYLWAKEEKLIPEDYHVWWGFEDKKLFKYAKNQLAKIASKNEPFNFTLLTADTHFIDGYLDDSCKKPFNSHYANAFHCSDSMIYEFVEWIKKQDFFKDTTLIIVGDHPTMQSNFYPEGTKYRTVYNVILNSLVEADNSKNRIATTFYMYPTTLASIGATIIGNKIGFGTNLYSNEKTLAEVVGTEYINKEFDKKSFYYDNEILGTSYYEMGG